MSYDDWKTTPPDDHICEECGATSYGWCPSCEPIEDDDGIDGPFNEMMEMAMDDDRDRELILAGAANCFGTDVTLQPAGRRWRVLAASDGNCLAIAWVEDEWPVFKPSGSTPRVLPAGPRALAVAWTRVCRELGRALAEFERCEADPPDFPSGDSWPDLNDTLHELMVYRDELRAWAELPPGDNDTRQAELTADQKLMVEQLDAMEDALNAKGHSMHEREEPTQ